MTPDLQCFDGVCGIVYVCYGEQYCRVGAVSAQSAHEQTGLPIHIITNLADYHRFDWPADATFCYRDEPDTENREVRTRLDEFTPFDRTLHTDADVYYADPDTRLPLGWLEHWDMVVVLYRTLRTGVWKSPQWAAIAGKLGTADFGSVCGGVLYFRKSAAVHEMFRWWNRYWRGDGKARDMPGLFRALWRSRVRFFPLPGEDVWIGVHEGHFRHSAGRQQVPELPRIRKLKPNGLDKDGRRTKWEPVGD